MGVMESSVGAAWRLTDAELVDVLVERDREFRHAYAELLRVVREAEDRGLHTGVNYPSLRELLHHVQGISRREASTRIEHARLRAATEGEVAPEQYEMMRRLGRELPAGLPVEAEVVLAEAAQSVDAKAMEPLGRELAARLDPDGPEPVEPKEHRRELYVSTRADGSVSFRGKVDPEAGQILTAAL